MILITKTLVIFHFWQPSWQSKSNQTKAIKLPQHGWSDRSEATLISKLTSLTSTHVRLVAVPSNSGIRKNSQIFTQFWRWLLKIWFLLRRRKHLWKDCFHVLTWACEHIKPCYNCYMQLCTAMDVHRRYVVCCNYRPAMIFTKFKQFLLSADIFRTKNCNYN